MRVSPPRATPADGASAARARGAGAFDPRGERLERMERRRTARLHEDREPVAEQRRARAEPCARDARDDCRGDGHEEPSAR
jgi:hypothetical protein